MDQAKRPKSDSRLSIAPFSEEAFTASGRREFLAFRDLKVGDSTDGKFGAMKFDPQLSVNVRNLIRAMRGEVVTLSKDQWEDYKECCADIMEQFLSLRKEQG